MKSIMISFQHHFNAMHHFSMLGMCNIKCYLDLSNVSNCNRCNDDSCIPPDRAFLNQQGCNYCDIEFESMEELLQSVKCFNHFCDDCDDCSDMNCKFGGLKFIHQKILEFGQDTIENLLKNCHSLLKTGTKRVHKM